MSAAASTPSFAAAAWARAASTSATTTEETSSKLFKVSACEVPIRPVPASPNLMWLPFWSGGGRTDHQRRVQQMPDRFGAFAPDPFEQCFDGQPAHFRPRLVHSGQ